MDIVIVGIYNILYIVNFEIMHCYFIGMEYLNEVVKKVNIQSINYAGMSFLLIKFQQ